MPRLVARRACRYMTSKYRDYGLTSYERKRLKRVRDLLTLMLLDDDGDDGDDEDEDLTLLLMAEYHRLKFVNVSDFLRLSSLFLL